MSNQSVSSKIPMGQKIAFGLGMLGDARVAASYSVVVGQIHMQEAQREKTLWQC
jgi:hypothetical protein